MTQRCRDSAAAALWCVLLAACSGAAATGGAGDPERELEMEADTEQPARPALCERNGDDLVRDVFCGPEPAAIADLADLQQQLGIVFSVGNGAEPDGKLSVVEFLGHSTALSGRLISPINPRVFMPSGNELVMAFQRGVQRVELAARARNDRRFRFYLVTFRQACNESKHGCGPGDLYTPRIEREWAEVAVEDDEDLKNTASDCRQCHQRGLDAPILLMRELRTPWTHFFVNPRLAEAIGQTPADEADALTGLGLDYQLAKGDEPYAGIDVSHLHKTQPGFLELSVDQRQPLIFNSKVIASERAATGRSATWDETYAGFKRGENLALPYFDERATDPEKQAALGAEYQRYLRDEIDADALPDLADVFPDDAQTRAEIGLQTEPSATPAETLIQACGSCHNDVLDQSISRARFNIALERMSREQLERALDRLQRSSDDPEVMPPREARQLDPDARQALIAYLKRSELPAADQALLQSAAVSGMAGTIQR